jgi:hypothetical protein
MLVGIICAAVCMLLLSVVWCTVLRLFLCGTMDDNEDIEMTEHLNSDNESEKKSEEKKHEIYLPGQPLKEDEELVCDESTYVMLHEVHAGKILLHVVSDIALMVQKIIILCIFYVLFCISFTSRNLCYSEVNLTTSLLFMCLFQDHLALVSIFFTTALVIKENCIHCVPML